MSDSPVAFSIPRYSLDWQMQEEYANPTGGWVKYEDVERFISEGNAKYEQLQADMKAYTSGLQRGADSLRTERDEKDRLLAACYDRMGRHGNLLRRIRAWDMMDAAADGKYWRSEIDKALAAESATDREALARGEIPAHIASPYAEQMLKDAQTVLRGFDEGVFVRDVSRDHESGWALRVMPFIAALSRLALAKNPCPHETVLQTITRTKGLRTDTETRCTACGELLKSTGLDTPLTVAPPAWVPVSERLPANAEHVLISTTLWRDAHDAIRCEGRWMNLSMQCDHEDVDHEVAYWIEKPAPPTAPLERDGMYAVAFHADGTSTDLNAVFPDVARTVLLPQNDFSTQHNTKGNTMIRPTNGRVVWYYPDGAKGLDAGDQPRPATVAYVHSDTCINVGYLDVNGNPKSATSVKLLQDDEPATAAPFAMWMPYQKGQAAKVEALEKQVAGA